MIISGGENISSVEVEGALLRHPAVQEVAIVGLPDERWGEAPHAFVVLNAGATATKAELRNYARDHLAPPVDGVSRRNVRRHCSRAPRLRASAPRAFQSAQGNHLSARAAQNRHGQSSKICPAWRQVGDLPAVKLFVERHPRRKLTF